MNVGIIGLGYVGSAIVNAYSQKNINIHTFDIDLSKNPTCEYFCDFIEKTNFIYISVPTPMAQDGSCDTSIVEQVVNDVCMAVDTKTVIIKSTVPPGTTEKLQKKYINHNILFSPEFLTEANHLDDYLNQDLMLIGKPENVSIDVANLVLNNQISTINSVRYAAVFPSTTVEMYKYVANVFLATKVSFANEMADIAVGAGVDWNQIQQLVVHDSRLGKTHWKVPGHDGYRGFGGTCFPKDISAIINYAKIKNVPTPLLTSVWNRNILIDRPEKDWERMKGRAVSD